MNKYKDTRCEIDLDQFYEFTPLRFDNMRQDNDTLKCDVYFEGVYKELSISYDGNLEEAVKTLILLALGIHPSDIVRMMGCVKTKWLPSPGDTYFFMNDDLEVDFDVYTGGVFDQAHIRSGNYFKSKDQASAKVEKVRKMFNEDL